jgi:hypothetical protein
LRPHQERNEQCLHGRDIERRLPDWEQNHFGKFWWPPHRSRNQQLRKAPTRPTMPFRSFLMQKVRSANFHHHRLGALAWGAPAWGRPHLRDFVDGHIAYHHGVEGGWIACCRGCTGAGSRWCRCSCRRGTGRRGRGWSEGRAEPPEPRIRACAPEVAREPSPTPSPLPPLQGGFLFVRGPGVPLVPRFTPG